MKITSSFRVMLFAGISLFYGSCVKQSDLEMKNVRINGFTPEFAAPLINANLNINELLKQPTVSNYVQINTDGYLSLVHEGFSYSLSADQFVTLPVLFTASSAYKLNNTELSTFNSASIGTSVSSTSTNTFSFISIIEVDEILYKSGQFALNVQNNYPANLSYTATVLDLTANGNPLVLTGNANSLGGSNVSANLNGYLGDFTAGNPLNHTQLRIRFDFNLTKGAASALASQDIDVRADIINSNYRTLRGYFGTASTALPSVSVPIDVFNDNRGTINFENPKIDLKITNGLGLPVEVSSLSPFNLKMANNSIVNITGVTTPLNINPATSFSSPGVTNVNLNGFNSNIKTIIPGRPKEFNFGGSIATNPSGKGSVRNFVSDTSKVVLDGRFELPLWLTAKDFGLRDTQALDLASLGQEAIEWLELRFIISNGLPIENQLQIYIFDSTNNVLIDSLFSPGLQPILPGAITNGSGVVTANANKTFDVRVTKQRLDIWNRLNANSMIFDAAVTTTSNGSIPVKIFPNQAIKIKVSARTKLTGIIN
jgi:hypothetical protein